MDKLRVYKQKIGCRRNAALTKTVNIFVAAVNWHFLLRFLMHLAKHH